MKTDTRRLSITAMLCALAYIVMVIGRVPIVLFLKYDPKDVIITIGGFIFGPMTSLMMSLVVSFVEFFTVSDTGIFGFIMNVISSCAFACTAAVIYKKKHTISGAVIGLITGALTATGVMLLWNYFIMPYYMGQPREAIEKLILPALLPFNLLKGGLNATITMLLYKPAVKALRKAHLIPESAGQDVKAGKLNLGVMLISAFALATCIFFVLVLKGVL